MVYETMSDMFIDNRNGIAHSLKELNASKDVIEEALCGYDYAVCKALEVQKSYSLLKDAVIKMVDKETFEKIERETCIDLLCLVENVAKYIDDVKSNKKVGYSAEE